MTKCMIYNITNFATGMLAEGHVEGSILSAATELMSCVKLHFTITGLFTIRPVISASLRAHVLPNIFILINTMNINSLRISKT